MKTYIISSDTTERDWLSAACKMVRPMDTVICHERGVELSVDDNNFTGAFIMVTQEQFPALRRQLSKQYSAIELPCPILVLTESFDSFDVGGYRHCTLDAFPSHAITPQILHYLINTLRRDYKKDMRLKRLAHYDQLTGACNRYLFNDRAKQAISAAKRQQETLSFMYFDLDDFKSINDQYGHHTGDEYLKTFSQRLQENIRDMDTLGRLGGDEFALLLPKLSESNALAMANRIMKSLRQSHLINGHSVSIRTSVGIVVFDGASESDSSSYKQLLDFADKALLRAKLDGKNTINVYKVSPSKQNAHALAV